MEIWIKGKEWYPIIISHVSRHRYLVSWGDVAFEFNDPEKVYHYVLRIFKVIGKG
ncbi:hypothetical protein [Parapedobacter koreensis]|nr:hypothetical protein [Parapedobacter koreensis]